MLAFTARFALLMFLSGSVTVLAQYYNLQGFWKTSASANGWQTYSPSGAPIVRTDHAIVWTGTKMIVWGGRNSSSNPTNTGGIYDPVTNTWSAVTTTGAPSARYYHYVVWAGSKMIVWGGETGSGATNTGGIYDPWTDSWTSTTTTSAPVAREGHVAVWTGSHMVVWGGVSGSTYYNSGGRYNPATDTWSATTTTGAPAGSDAAHVVWTGTKMIVWGGYITSAAVNTGGQYDPINDSWSTVTTTGAPAASVYGAHAWTGTKMIVWGGFDGNTTMRTAGGLYDPVGDSWTSMSTTSAPPGKVSSAAQWTGDKFFVWGGGDYGTTPTNVGGIYDPAGNSWTATSATGVPTAQWPGWGPVYSVWTGSVVLIFGGLTNNNVYSYNMTPPVLSLTVAKVYPTNGSRFMQYIKGNNGGTNMFNQKDVACAGTETNHVFACIHGGDKLKVQLTNYRSCRNLSMTDYLDAFEWTCVEESGNVTFYSPGFKVGKGLSDIIDFTTHDFLNNYVTARYNTTTIGTSSSSQWWSTATNPIQAAPSATASLQTLTGYTAGTILTVDASAQIYGYNINQDSLALVAKNGAVLTSAVISNNCQWQNGETASPTTKSIICTGSQKYLWVEATIDDTNNTVEVGMTITLTKFSRFNKIKTLNTIYESLLFYYSDYNYLSSVSTEDANGYWYMLSLEESEYNFLHNIRVHHTRLQSQTNPAMALTNNSNYNIVHDVTVSQSNQYGITLDYASNNRITKATVANNDAGIRLGAGSVASYNTLSHVTLLNNYQYSLLVQGATVQYNTFNQFLMGGSESSPNIGMTSSTNSILSQFAISSIDNNFYFLLSSSSNNKFTNNMVSRNAAGNDCSITGGTNPGITGTTTCANQGTSDATWVTPFTLASYTSHFVGKVTSNDTTNTSDSSGSQSFASISDWGSFDNSFRAWGRDSGTTGECISGDTCRIWDARLASADTYVRNTSNDGSTQNATFVADSTCPAAVHGNKALTDQMLTTNTFLINALEIVNDGLGDEDGLCESSEACIYSPNFGSYQGEGDYKSNGTCIFQNGTVKNVRMYAYPTNGA